MATNTEKTSPVVVAAATRRSLLALAATLLLPATANATTYEVSATGSPYSIATALAEAGPGDTVSLADGLYDEPITSVAGGEEGSPLLIEGGPDAIIQGAWGDLSRAVFISHSWITLKGFSIDGFVGTLDEADSYIDKCVFVQGSDDPISLEYEGETVESSLIGFIMNGLTISNCGGECVRLRNYVTNAEITDNSITNCGVFDFIFDDGGENGEAIYVGTSSNQWTDGPDGTNYNIISGNKITPNANECVDTKEGSTGNIIEYNECTNQLDVDSGCYDSRGSGNIIRYYAVPFPNFFGSSPHRVRTASPFSVEDGTCNADVQEYNTASNCAGAGTRLGGWEVDGVTYGQDNDVYDNYFTSTESGSVVARQIPQGTVCGNTCEDGECTADSEDTSDSMLTTWDQTCGGSSSTTSADDSSSATASTVATSTGGDDSTTPTEDDSTAPSDDDGTSTTEDDGISTTKDDGVSTTEDDDGTSRAEDDGISTTEDDGVSTTEDDDGISTAEDDRISTTEDDRISTKDDDETSISDDDGTSTTEDDGSDGDGGDGSDDGDDGNDSGDSDDDDN